MKLDDLIKEGWKDSKHKYSDYLILTRGEERVLYDFKGCKVVVRYRVNIIKEPLGVGA